LFKANSTQEAKGSIKLKFTTATLIPQGGPWTTTATMIIKIVILKTDLELAWKKRCIHITGSYSDGWLNKPQNL
jgi:hypothetical protein